jgi:hypothetical protein
LRGARRQRAARVRVLRRTLGTRVNSRRRRGDVAAGLMPARPAAVLEGAPVVSSHARRVAGEIARSEGGALLLGELSGSAHDLGRCCENRKRRPAVSPGARQSGLAALSPSCPRSPYAAGA